jgi:integrase
MSASPLLNAAGRRRSPATLPGYLAGHPPRNKGLRYPPDPPTVEGIVAVMRQAGDGVHGARVRALIVLLWRAGLRIHEAMTLTEHDLEPRAGSVLVRHGKGGRRREIGMDRWDFEQLGPWLELRLGMPVGLLLRQAIITMLARALRATPASALAEPGAWQRRRSARLGLPIPDATSSWRRGGGRQPAGAYEPLNLGPAS